MSGRERKSLSERDQDQGAPDQTPDPRRADAQTLQSRRNAGEVYRTARHSV